jgi:hypothetical protein
LKQDDWVEVTMDDTSYKNVQSIRIIAEPAGQNVPSQAGGEQSGGGAPAAGGGTRANSSDKMSKAEWAAKDTKKELGVARSVALKAAVAAVSSDGKGFTGGKMKQIVKMAGGFTSFLLNGDFEGKPEADVPAPPPPPPVAGPNKEPGDDRAEGQATDGGEKAPIDDDIPF